MSAHTPGPWEFDEENNYGGSVWLGGTNVTVGLDRCDRFTGELVISRDELCANGRLIAAAPDLLEALEVVTNALGEHLGRKFPNDNHPHDRAIKKARAAISKARGGK